AMDKVVTAGRSGFEFKHRLAGGEIRDVEVFSGPIKVNNRNLIYSIINDITERKRSRQELITAKNKAEENDKLKTAFLNNMSHEIRTPMNGILGFSSLLMQDNLSDKRRKEYINIIENSGEQLMRIIDDIIDYSRIETGQVDIIKTEFRLNETIDTIYSILEQEASRRKKNIKIRVHKALPEGEDIILTDKGRLAQIINNLGMNALKFTDDGTIELGYELVNGDLRFLVKDTGIGIPEDEREKIFDRFHQVNNDLARSYSGTGLGLSIAQGLTKLLGGDIYFDSSPGEGSVFYVHLPYSAAYKLKNDRSPGKKNKTDFKGKTFLVAEDVPESLELIKSYLSSSGAKIVVAMNGDQAIEQVKNHNHIDLVLMDIRMPGTDGVKAMKAIKKLSPGLPVIAQTAYAMASDRATCLESGFDEYISKPLKKDELIGIAGKCLSDRSENRMK
ncbi:MAG TPA: response regulator, partial [Bacteroidales bacterium]|nr:response regulator [Bacteroidales bacterium]